jgi:hypothetical protein
MGFLKFIFYVGMLVTLLYFFCLTGLLFLSITGRTSLGHIPTFPAPPFFGLLALLAVNGLMVSYFMLGKSNRFRKIAIWITYVLALVSLSFIFVGLATNNRFTGDETNIGFVWVVMAAIFRLMILIKDILGGKLNSPTAGDPN